MAIDESIRFNRRAIKVAEAQQHILAHCSKLPEMQQPLAACTGCYLAADVHAPMPIPHFDRSGLDGYAVRYEDAFDASVQQPAELAVVAGIAAGDKPKTDELATGTAVRIMTGAVVPPGANAVVMLEQTDTIASDAEEVIVRIKHPVRCGQHITRAGDEVRSGDLLMPRGALIQPGHIALLAAAGITDPMIVRKPVVAIIGVGSELIGLNAPLESGKIRNSNAYMLAGQVELCGGIPLLLGIVDDRLQAVEAVLAEAAIQADLIVTSGAVSVGDYDVMAELFRSDKVELLFNKVAMRPGSPTSAALYNGKLLFGLSGNPGACFVGFELMVKPAVRALLGAVYALPQTVKAILGDSYPKGSPHDRYERGKSQIEQGRYTVYALQGGKSSMMRSIQQADCLIRIPSGSQGAAEGDLVDVIQLSYRPTE